MTRVDWVSARPRTLKVSVSPTIWWRSAWTPPRRALRLQELSDDVLRLVVALLPRQCQLHLAPMCSALYEACVPLIWRDLSMVADRETCRCLANAWILQARARCRAISAYGQLRRHVQSVRIEVPPMDDKGLGRALTRDLALMLWPVRERLLSFELIFRGDIPHYGAVCVSTALIDLLFVGAPSLRSLTLYRVQLPEPTAWPSTRRHRDMALPFAAADSLVSLRLCESSSELFTFCAPSLSQLTTLSLTSADDAVWPSMPTLWSLLIALELREHREPTLRAIDEHLKAGGRLLALRHLATDELIGPDNIESYMPRFGHCRLLSFGAVLDLAASPDTMAQLGRAFPGLEHLALSLVDWRVGRRGT